MTTFVCQKLAEPTDKGNKWLLHNEHPDGSRTLLGFHKSRKACLLVARIFGGRRKVEVRHKAIRLDAWRVA
ncbi:hypothetical protein FJ420_02035 [Mesorhizobium sp. B3-1-3]|uniref:hypothetical protein n=1 Tax=unclassified Mesorhizobium TaxID=325217 RepID=UPI00112A31C1|nr:MULTISPECIES: hypothetical protein [unclassified Mesorhizobium]TPI67610.1 hypothetical protein FJ424_10005 [Mesorhizobium sp. B3-1-8]TPI75656.1 hypothetical protein FJ420_02035 [Mesorhizobium sp. B3-1-3]